MRRPTTAPRSSAYITMTGRSKGTPTVGQRAQPEQPALGAVHERLPLRPVRGMAATREQAEKCIKLARFSSLADAGQRVSRSVEGSLLGLS